MFKRSRICLHVKEKPKFKPYFSLTMYLYATTFEQPRQAGEFLFKIHTQLNIATHGLKTHN